MKNLSIQVEDPPLSVADRRHELEYAKRTIARARIGLYPGMEAGLRSLNAVQDEASRRGDQDGFLSALSACQLLSCGRLPGTNLCINAVQQLTMALDTGDFATDDAPPCPTTSPR